MCAVSLLMFIFIFFHGNVEIGATKAKGADPSTPRDVAFLAEPWTGFRINIES
jgi:hypothetical protein